MSSELVEQRDEWTRRPIAVVDVETTGLDPAVDQIWEVAVIRIERIAMYPDGPLGWEIASRCWMVQHDVTLVERLPERYRELHDGRFDDEAAGSALWTAQRLEHLLAGVTLVGAVPSFDASMIEALMRSTGVRTSGQSVPWHHRLRCVEAMTAGRLGVDPGGLTECLAALGLPANPAPHTALGDAGAAFRILTHLTCVPEPM